MKRVLQGQRHRAPKARRLAAFPVDSEYIIFIVDTSASMTSAHWKQAQQTVQEILSIYPSVKGMQIMDDEGKVMIAGTRGQWITDSPEQRQQIVARIDKWRAFSNSSPVEGIEEAIKTYWAPDKRISLYVLGDEYTGDSIQQALDDVSAINKPDRAGRRMVRIHAIGFPESPGMTPFTSIRFSALMRLDVRAEQRHVRRHHRLNRSLSWPDLRRPASLDDVMLRTARLLTVTAGLLTLAACGGVAIHPATKLPKPLVVVLPAHVGLVIPAEMRNFTHSETRWGVEWNVALGDGHHDLDGRGAERHLQPKSANSRISTTRAPRPISRPSSSRASSSIRS